MTNEKDLFILNGPAKVAYSDLDGTNIKTQLVLACCDILRDAYAKYDKKYGASPTTPNVAIKRPKDWKN